MVICCYKLWSFSLWITLFTMNYYELLFSPDPFFLSSPSVSIGEPCFSVMLECLYRASMQFLSGNHDIFWIPACFDRFSNLRDWAWEKALKAFISRRARRERRERWDRLVARIQRQTNSVHTSCPSGRSIQQFAPLPFNYFHVFHCFFFFCHARMPLSGIHAVSIGEPLHLLDSR